MNRDITNKHESLNFCDLLSTASVTTFGGATIDTTKYAGGVFSFDFEKITADGSTVTAEAYDLAGYDAIDVRILESDDDVTYTACINNLNPQGLTVDDDGYVDVEELEQDSGAYKIGVFGTKRYIKLVFNPSVLDEGDASIYGLVNFTGELLKR